MNSLNRYTNARNVLRNNFVPLTKINSFSENLNNSFEHEALKFKVYWLLRKQGFSVVVEGKFSDGRGIPDLFCLDTKTCYEIVHTESEDSIESKIDRYRFAVIRVRTDEAFDEKKVL
jgi:hypothetical protein